MEEQEAVRPKGGKVWAMRGGGGGVGRRTIREGDEGRRSGSE